MIAIVDYGMGNLRSVEKALSYLSYKAKITNEPEKVLNADRVILPGVGAFADCLSGLKNSGLYDAVLEFITFGKPFLGICVGMQMLFEKSFEFGMHKGIGVFNGAIKKFPDEIIKNGMKIPHMGWNQIEFTKFHELFENIEDLTNFYFVHSYYAPVNEQESIAICNYGVKFAAAVAKDNVIATQFHPEKSQKAGLAFLKNFGEWKC
jgi:glutamine amidotransferase